MTTDTVTEPAAPPQDPATEPEPVDTPEPQAPDIDWKQMARKHETEAKKARAELDKIRKDSMSDTERAIAEAEARGRATATSEMASANALAAFRAAAAEAGVRLADVVDLIDVSRFVSDGTVDEQAITAAVERFAAIATTTAKPPAAPTGGPQTPPPPNPNFLADIFG
ncbi:MAG: hypothetical protein ACKOWN_03385 [Microbacteriaceae bacterium]